VLHQYHAEDDQNEHGIKNITKNSFKVSPASNICTMGRYQVPNDNACELVNRPFPRADNNARRIQIKINQKKKQKLEKQK